MSASNTLEAEDLAEAREIADRRDAKRWRRLMGPSAPDSEPTAMDILRTVSDGLRCARWLDDARSTDLSGLTEAVLALTLRADAAESEAAAILADLAEVTDERNKQRARADSLARQLRTQDTDR